MEIATDEHGNWCRHFVVYGVFDPRDDTLVYIGQTSNLQNRERTIQNGGHSATSPFGRWLRDIIDEGLVPVVRQLVELKAEYRSPYVRIATDGAERGLIQAYARRVGSSLLNVRGNKKREQEMFKRREEKKLAARKDG